jgi:hypothetical protein
MKQFLPANVIESQSIFELPERDLLNARAHITSLDVDVVVAWLTANILNFNISNISVLSGNDVDVTVKDLVDAENLCVQAIALFSAQCEASLV